MSVNGAMVSVSSPSYATQPSYSLSGRFEPRTHLFTVIGAAAAAVFGSFDGVNDHLRLQQGSSSESLAWDTAMGNVWFRMAVGESCQVFISSSSEGG